jgi:cytochrome c peroxidase
MQKWKGPLYGIGLGIGITAMLTAGTGWTADDADLRTHLLAKNRGKLTLGEVPVPRPPKLNNFVVNEQAAIALGKALFWDMQAGGDGVLACASCHFRAGADSRAKNQINPGPDNSFELTPTGNYGPNSTLTDDDFPFPKELNDRVSSQGVFLRTFDHTIFNPADACTSLPDPPYTVGDVNVRRVEPRNSPTTINAVFNHRNFWDGRANDTFNGQNPGGIRDTNAKAAVWNSSTNTIRFEQLVDAQGRPLLINASLASQAVGPPLSIFEMSCGALSARSFPDLGRKLFLLRPLAKQMVHPNDSVLAPYRYVTGMGLKTTYGKLITQAFNQKYWGYKGRITGSDYTQMEINFPLFWGLAIQLYEATLVSGDTNYDRWAGGDDSALTEQEKLGLKVFSGFPGVTDGKCINCHVGPEFTGASVRLRACQTAGGKEEAVERMIMGDGATALYDGGFYNIGVRATGEDLGVGENNLAFSRQVSQGVVEDLFCFHPERFESPGDILAGERITINGAFKTPTIRNVELTAPFFHNGGHATLEQVVEFYDSGAGDDRCGPELGFHEENIADLDPDIVCLGLSTEEEAALVAFMKALTDERVRYEKAPFDHPQLFLTNGHPLDQGTVIPSQPGSIEAEDTLAEIPAVGAAGRTAKPSNFLETPEVF